MIDRLLVGDPLRPRFQAYARGLLRPAFDRIGWEPKKGEPIAGSLLRVTLIRALGTLDDSDVVAGCRARFDKFINDPGSLSPDLRPVVLGVVGRYADSQTWEKLHKLGLKTASTEEKGYSYDALARATAPALISRTIALALTDELPTSRASGLLGLSARHGEHPDLVWDFAQAHMKALLAKQDGLAINSFAAGLFNFFSNPKEAEKLQTYAKTNLPPAAAEDVAKAIDEIGFHADLKQRLVPQLANWIGQGAKAP